MSEGKRQSRARENVSQERTLGQSVLTNLVTDYLYLYLCLCLYAYLCLRQNVYAYVTSQHV